MDALDRRTDELRRALLADPETRETARAMAWCEHGAPSMRIEAGHLVGVPDGWPPLVDPEKYLIAFVDRGLYTGDAHEQARS